NVGVSKRIDSLFRVTNQKYASASLRRFKLIDLIKYRVLNRVSVLKLINHRYRELLPNGLRERFAKFTIQGIAQARQHVIETHLGALLLKCCKTFLEPLSRVL